MSFFRSTHLSIRFSFFLHGESQVCASIDVRQHMPLRRLQPYHLSVATQDHQQVPGNLSLKSFVIASCIITSRRRSCGKVMFSQVSIILLRGEEGDPHVAITYDALGPSPLPLDTRQKTYLPLFWIPDIGPLPSPWIADRRPTSLPDICWSSLETCSDLFT